MKYKITIVFLVVVILLYFLAKPYLTFINRTLKVSILKALISHDSLKTFDNQVNMLILGIPGGEYQGPNLSDSITVANYNFTNNQITTFSIPRDIWSDTLRDKINSAYAYGEAKAVGGGLKLAKAEVSTIIGQPIQYAAVIDFSKFEKIIDFLGGIQIEVDRSFTDKKFPIPGKEDDECGGNDPDFKCRYETITFNKGTMVMDGKTALKFVRSRNAVGTEGSDFARENRQQKVIDAVEKKIVQQLKNLSLKNLDALYQQFNQLVKRDINNQQLAIIAKNALVKKLIGKDLKRKQATLSENFFYVPAYYEYDGKYVLIPDDEDFAKVHQYINCQITDMVHCENLIPKDNNQ